VTRTADRGTLPPPLDSILSAVRVVLYEPQDPVNIATTIRAMKNMGCSNLYLVRSVEYDPWRLEGIAHDTGDIIERIRNCSTIDEALDGCVRVAGFTARRRAAKRDVTTPRAASGELLDSARTGPVALLFGREDKGLPNEILDRAHLVRAELAARGDARDLDQGAGLQAQVGQIQQERR